MAGGTPRRVLCSGELGLKLECAEPLALPVLRSQGQLVSHPFPSSDPGLAASFLDYAGSAGWALPGLGQQMAAGMAPGGPCR